MAQNVSTEDGRQAVAPYEVGTGRKDLLGQTGKDETGEIPNGFRVNGRP